MIEILSLIGAFAVAWIAYTAIKFTAFRSRMIGAMVAYGLSKPVAEYLYASQTQQIHDAHFKHDLAPEEIAQMLADNFKDTGLI